MQKPTGEDLRMTKDIETKLSELGINQKILATGHCVTQIDRTKTSTIRFHDSIVAKVFETTRNICESID